MNENTAYIEQLQVDTSNKKVYYSQKILDEYKKIDSMLAARNKSKIKLSFMGYELGKSYSNAKGERKKLLEKNITRLEISHYDDTIYQIRAKIEDYKNGLYKFDKDVINLYRTKYGRESKSDKGIYSEFMEWSYSNGKIGIKLEKREFDHRGFIISKNAVKPTTYIPSKKTVEIVITYLDYGADSIATQKKRRDILLQEELEKKKKQEHYQESFENI